MEELDEEMILMNMIDDYDDDHQNYEMPSEYIWNEEDRECEENEEQIMEMMMMRTSRNHALESPSNKLVDALVTPPIIDMALSPIELQRELSFACLNWGVFYIANHDIPNELLNNVLNLSFALFSLPLSIKLNARRSPNGSSFNGFGQPIIAKFFKKRSWTQGFTMMGSSIAHTTSKLLPSPQHPNPFREPFEEYEQTMRTLVGKLLIEILLGLGVDMDKFNHMQFNPSMDCHGALQLNYYPKCPQPNLTIGLPSHTDSTFLTVLHQGDVPGLEIYKDGRWMVVPPRPDMLLVHVGDMLQVLSNDMYKSILHRAIPNKKTARLSIAYLCGPPLNASIKPPIEVVKSSKNQQSLYKSLTWMEYLQMKTKYFMRSLEYFKTQTKN